MRNRRSCSKIVENLCIYIYIVIDLIWNFNQKQLYTYFKNTHFFNFLDLKSIIRGHILNLFIIRFQNKHYKIQ